MLHAALAGMTSLPQWFTWRLTWDAHAGKYHKTPCYPDGRLDAMDAHSPANWSPYPTALDALAQLNARQDGHAYALGFMLTANCGYWFLDADGVVIDGQVSELGQRLYQQLPGAFFEYSSSGRGLHWIGRGKVPEHSTRNKTYGLELYTQARGICFGLSGQAWGSADTDHTAVISQLALELFPPLAERMDVAIGSGPRAEWRGPTDDVELIRRAMASVSDAAKLGGKATFADLWTRNVPKLAHTYPPDSESDREAGYGQSEADLALAQHLAFWTGCDIDRMCRLMRQSALARPKWDEHRTYLKEHTCVAAVSRQRDVLVDKERVLQMPVEVTPEQAAINANYIQRIQQAEEDQLRNEIIPEIAQDRFIDHLDRARLAMLIKERFAVFRIPVSIAQARTMIATEVVDGDDEDAPDVPLWANGHVYVERGDFFFHLETGHSMSRSAFNAKYNRVMPMRPNGDREEAAKWALERWNMTTVADTMYRPDRELLFVEDKQWYANDFSPASLPEVTPYTDAGVAAINLFMRHLWTFCGARQVVYEELLSFLAHNVQHPGVKIRWAPLLKGMQGDGKSIIGDVLQAAMGFRNIGRISNKAIQSEYNDWAAGYAVSCIEEIMMTGSRRYAIANAIKENLSNSTLGLNRKGRTAITVRNVTNYIAFTNHGDAIPLEDDDRKWLIIFSASNGLSDLLRNYGVPSAHELQRQVFTPIFDSLHREPGQWRKWLLECPITAGFDPNGRALDTAEKGSMRASGESTHDEIARMVIMEGAYGVTENVIDSASLSHAMRIACVAAGAEIPKTTALNHMLARLGYVRYTNNAFIKWDGASRRIWWKHGCVPVPSNEWLRAELDRSKAKVTSHELSQVQFPTCDLPNH